MRSSGFTFIANLLLAVGLSCNLVFAAPSSVQTNALEKLADGIVVSVAGGFLKIEVVAADVVRVAFAKDRAFFDKKSLATAPKRSEPTKWDLETAAREATVSTPKLKVRVA